MRRIAIILISIISTTGCSSQNIELARNGSSQWRIYADPSSPLNGEAAKVLQTYFEQATGVRLPMDNKRNEGHYFIIGDRAVAGLDKIEADGFVIDGNKNNISIAGNKGRSVLYGVYAFIEKYLNCRKWDGGKAYMPKQQSVSIPPNIKERQEPAFVYREVYFPPSFDNEYLDWHRLHRFEERWGLWGHSFFKLVSPDKYFKTHPEYFSLIDGRRQPIQLCLSNASVKQIVINELKARMSDNPSALYWSVAQNDDIGPCECDNCKRIDARDGGAQGSLLNFVNGIADQFPEKIITTLAYGYTAHPPLQTHAAVNVVVMLSTIDATRTHPLISEPTAAKFRNELKQWQLKCSNLFVWDYNTQFTNYLAPFPIESNFASDTKYFKTENIKGVFAQGSGDTYADMSELKSYLLAKLQWNPYLNADSLIHEFISGYYGKAAQEIETLVQEMRANVKGNLDIYGNPINDHEDYLSPANIDRYSTLMDKAESLTERDPVELRRVRKIRLSQEYAYLQQLKFYGKDQHGIYTKDENGNYNIRAGLDKRVQNFTRSCEKEGIKQLSETGGKIQQYLADWKEILQKPVPVNVAANAAVTIKYPFVSDYPAKKERTLVDETPGYNDFSYNWLCFYEKPMDAVVDMGSSKFVHTISLHFLEDARHWIFHPTTITIEYSTDGQKFQQLSTQKTPAPGEDYTVNIAQYIFPLNQNARYIRVRADNQPALPSWRYHRKKKPMIACDEIWVN